MINIKNLSFTYDGKDEALKNINLKINKGRWISILGHNGSGKSTLAKILVGLLEFNQGEVDIDGLVLNYENLAEVRKKIGIVFQNPDNQFVGVTVKHDVAFGLENQNMNHLDMEEKIEKYLSYVNMDQFKNKEPHNLSGGQKQKVAIAGILSMDLDYIILDEATSMLDPEGANEIVKLISHLNKNENKTIITITHDLSFAALSDYLVVLKDGELILEGSPKEVFAEEEILISSNLELPMEIKLANEYKNNQDLKEALWELSSKM